MPPYFFLLSIKSFETHRFFKFNLNRIDGIKFMLQFWNRIIGVIFHTKNVNFQSFVLLNSGL